ncbi:MAG TPA: GGDEF domain-containing protein [Burkholderiaceae bacterium]
MAFAARPMPTPDDRLPEPVRLHLEAGAVSNDTPRPDARPDIAIEHWDDLFSAVTARLRRVVGERSQRLSEAQGRGADGQVRTGVLECAEALDQLQATLRHELGRRPRLEIEVFDARTALAQARAERVGTRIEEPQALHDGLTALPNRCFFRQRLDHELALRETRRDAVSVLALDLDGFRSINEIHGRTVGDELWRAVAARLTRAVRAEDLMSRMAADEFACLVTDLPSRAALINLACKLFDALSAPFQIGTLRLTVRPSIGIATGRSGGANAEALLGNAGTAMARARRQHIGYALFDECDDAQARGSDA